MNFNDFLPLILPYVVYALITAIIVSELRKQLEQYTIIKNSKIYQEKILQALPYLVAAGINYYIQRSIYTLDYKFIVISAALSSYTYRIFKKVMSAKTTEIEETIDKME